MNYIYIIYNEVFGSETPYPNQENFKPCLYATFEDYLEGWKKSLIKLECSQVELNKIYTWLSLTDLKETLRDTIKNPVDITLITSVKSITDPFCSICSRTIREQAKGCNRIECYKGRPGYPFYNVFFNNSKSDAEKLRLATNRMLDEINASEETRKYWNDFTENFIKEKLNKEEVCQNKDDYKSVIFTKEK